MVVRGHPIVTDSPTSGEDSRRDTETITHVGRHHVLAIGVEGMPRAAQVVAGGAGAHAGVQLCVVTASQLSQGGFPDESFFAIVFGAAAVFMVGCGATLFATEPAHREE